MHFTNDILIVIKRACLSENPRISESDISTIHEIFASRGYSSTVIFADDLDAVVDYAKGHQDAITIVFGGDGTLIGIARELLESGITLPMLGVNYGKVGFLSEFQDHCISATKKICEMLSAGSYRIEPRIALKWRVRRDSNIVGFGYALNDAVVSRRGLFARVCEFSCSIGGEELGIFRTDGIIVATPTGTSGYAYSVSGNLSHPNAQVVSLTPVASCFSHFPNLILPIDMEIIIKVEKQSNTSGLTIDGQKGLPLMQGDVVSIIGESDAFIMIVPDGNSYFARLKRCGFIY